MSEPIPFEPYELVVSGQKYTVVEPSEPTSHRVEHLGKVIGIHCADSSQPLTVEALETYLAGPTQAEQIAAMRAALKARATERRWQVETGGVVIGGVQVATDDRAKTLLTGADRKARRDAAYTTRWKGVNGAWVDLDAPTIIAIADAVFDHVDACFSREGELHAEIDAAPDLAALGAIKPTVETFAL